MSPGEAQNRSIASWSHSLFPLLPEAVLLLNRLISSRGSLRGSLLIGKPGTGKSRIAKAIALTAIERCYRVFYREAHVLIEEIHAARQLGEIAKYRATLAAAALVVIDELFLRRLPPGAGDELADVIMSRYEKSSTMVTSNRPIEDWPQLLGGDVVIVAPLLDRLMHHGHLLRFEGRSWRLREAAERVANLAATG